MLTSVCLLIFLSAHSGIEKQDSGVAQDSSSIQSSTHHSTAMRLEGIRDPIIGLKWGWSPADVKKSNNKIKLSYCFGEICRYEMRSPPKGISRMLKNHAFRPIIGSAA